MKSLIRNIDVWWFGLAVAALIIAQPGRTLAAGVGGTLKLTSSGTPTDGHCNDSYDDVCPSTDNCICQEYKGSLSGHFGGRNGRGSADLFLTIDNGLATAEPNGCRPFFGNGFLSTPLGPITINTTGAFCDSIGNSSQMKLLGGFGIAPGGAVPVGLGTISGAFDKNRNILTVKFSGRTE